MRFSLCREPALPAREKEILDWWQRQRIFEQCMQQSRDRPPFTFYEGPPTANGSPGLHHVLGRTLKDIICRYRSMKGYRVDRRAGWDTHGLPVEIEVEKKLGLKERAAIEQYGIAAFNAACRESVMHYKKEWDQLTRRIAYWVDLQQPYVTCENDYIESTWWLIKRIHELGLLYRGSKIQWYSPGSGTVLSSHEVSLGYQEITDPGAFVRFRCQDDADCSLLAWTTTPWTLPANAALAVDAEVVYATVELECKDGRERLILAEERREILRAPHRVLARCTGRELSSRRYQPLYPPPGAAPGETTANTWRVLCADFVSTEEGSGIVHVAPAFGADDHRLGQQAKLPVFNPIDPQGRFNDTAPAIVAGLWFKDADARILADLRHRGLLYRLDQHRHNYPHDWRRGTPLMNFPVQGWFIRTSALRERLLRHNNAIRWIPAAIGRGRFGNWLENNVDWALSRRRFWGTPLPIWSSDQPGSEHFEVIGALAELRDKCGGTLPPDLDLHRPQIDQLHWPAPDGGTMRRVPDVIDVWFDSGAMPFAQWHYPFENRERFQRSFPADFIAEGLDQTRGWFYTLHAIAVAVMDAPAYRNVVVNGLVLDENGEKMSKSRGNAVEPFAVLEKHGADVLRWYLSSNSMPWENLRFREQGLAETQRRFFGKLDNVYAFLASYANIDGFDDTAPALPIAQRSELDRWILSRLQSTVAQTDEALQAYDNCRAARALQVLADDLSNWYIRRSRRRFWRAYKDQKADFSDDADKLAAYQSTCDCLYTMAQLMAPIAPFFGEWLYQRLNEVGKRFREASVHLTRFPQVRAEWLDTALERRMELARQITSAALLIRNRCRINVRQPLPRLLLILPPSLRQQEIEPMRPVILEEVNVRELEYRSDADQLVTHSAQPNFRVLGPRLGPLMQPVHAAVKALDTETIEHFVRHGRMELQVQGQSVPIREGELEIRSQSAENLEMSETAGLTVALDTRLTPQLLASGMAREAAHRIQNLRKEQNLNLTDRIHIEYHASEQMENAIQQHADWIRQETLAVELRRMQSPGGQRFGIDTEQLWLSIRPTVLQNESSRS